MKARCWFNLQSLPHYNYYRDYDPGLGRYVESDPLGLDAVLNTYTYVGSRPLSSLDDDGLCEKRLMLVTAYCDKGPGSDWSFYKPQGRGKKPGSVGKGTCAVANARPQPYPYGCKMKILDNHGNPTQSCAVHDTGAGWDSKHHDVAPGDWIDIWMPSCKAARAFGKHWEVVEVCCDGCNKR
jgi:RHS repeat-associated protein